MNVLVALWLREVRALRSSLSCGLQLAAFLAAGGWTFVVTLRNNEGSVLQIQTIWGLAFAPWLPILSALLTARLFAEERSSGMLDLLMSAPVRERDLTVGKFLAAMTMVLVALGVSLATPLLLSVMVPQLLISLHWKAFAATFFALSMQASAWCAVGIMISALYRNAAAAAVSSLVLCGGAPIVIYTGILKWLPSVRIQMPWMPLLLHVYDFSTGFFSTASMVLYASLTLLFLFICSKVLLFLRVRG